MPNLTVIAGPNGSGKSTLIKYLQDQNIYFGTYINADDIAANHKLTGEDGSRKAQQIADEIRELCLKSSADFSFETVMSHESKPFLMENARTLGFHVTLYFVCTDDPQTNVSRVHYRAKHGGHDVPVDRIVGRYYRTLELLPRAIKASDLAVLFDNSVDRLINLETTLRPVAGFRRKSDGSIVQEFEDSPPPWAAKLINVLDIE
jgi:predicted ABC-type ATPase